MTSTASHAASESSAERRQEIAFVMQVVGGAMLASFLVDLLLQAWPLALLQPAWLDQMNGLLIGRGITPLTGAFLVAASPVVSAQSEGLANRARLLRRFASWVAIGYLLLIPVQLYAGVKLLREQQGQVFQLLEQASRSTQAIKDAVSEEQLREAYAQIPGPKVTLPENLPTPLSLVKEQLLAALEARNSRAAYEIDQRSRALWNQAIELMFGNILRALILAAGFAAMGRRSPGKPTLLHSLLSRKKRVHVKSASPGRNPVTALTGLGSWGRKKRRANPWKSKGSGEGR